MPQSSNFKLQKMITRELLYTLRNDLPMKLTIVRLGRLGTIVKFNRHLISGNVPYEASPVNIWIQNICSFHSSILKGTCHLYCMLTKVLSKRKELEHLSALLQLSVHALASSVLSSLANSNVPTSCSKVPEPSKMIGPESSVSSWI
jgi:hypothetical protein